jgi:hypothetical protein
MTHTLQQWNNIITTLMNSKSFENIHFNETIRSRHISLSRLEILFKHYNWLMNKPKFVTDIVEQLHIDEPNLWNMLLLSIHREQHSIKKYINEDVNNHEEMTRYIQKLCIIDKKLLLDN